MRVIRFPVTFPPNANMHGLSPREMIIHVFKTPFNAAGNPEIDGVYHYYINTVSLRHLNGKERINALTEYTDYGEVLYHRNGRRPWSIPASQAFGIHCFPSEFHVFDLDMLGQYFKEWWGWNDQNIKNALDFLKELIKAAEPAVPFITYQVVDGNHLHIQEHLPAAQAPPLLDEEEVRFRSELTAHITRMTEAYLTSYVNDPENNNSMKRELEEEYLTKKPDLVLKFRGELRKKLRRERDGKKKRKINL